MKKQFYFNHASHLNPLENLKELSPRSTYLFITFYMNEIEV